MVGKGGRREGWSKGGRKEGIRVVRMREEKKEGGRALLGRWQ